MSYKTVNKNLDYYLNLNYPITTYEDEEGGYVAEIKELRGCITQGETLEDLYDLIDDAKNAWIAAAFEQGIEIPEPEDMQEYSGRFVVRISRSLHRGLTRQAKQEGVSLNQHVSNLLTAGLYGVGTTPQYENAHTIWVANWDRIGTFWGVKRKPKSLSDVMKQTNIIGAGAYTKGG